MFLLLQTVVAAKPVLSCHNTKTFSFNLDHLMGSSSTNEGVND